MISHWDERCTKAVAAGWIVLTRPPIRKNVSLASADVPGQVRNRRDASSMKASDSFTVTTVTPVTVTPEEALSQAQRQAADDWYDHTLYSRLNDKLTAAIKLIPLIRTSRADAVQSLNAAAGRALGRGTRAGLAIWAKAYCGGTRRAYHASRRIYH